MPAPTTTSTTTAATSSAIGRSSRPANRRPNCPRRARTITLTKTTCQVTERSENQNQTVVCTSSFKRQPTVASSASCVLHPSERIGNRIIGARHFPHTNTHPLTHRSASRLWIHSSLSSLSERPYHPPTRSKFTSLSIVNSICD